MHITRLYFDIEKEINWLNEISSKGYRLKSRAGLHMNLNLAKQANTFIK